MLYESQRDMNCTKRTRTARLYQNSKFRLRYYTKHVPRSAWAQIWSTATHKWRRSSVLTFHVHVLVALVLVLVTGTYWVHTKCTTCTHKALFQIQASLLHQLGMCEHVSTILQQVWRYASKFKHVNTPYSLYSYCTCGMSHRDISTVQNGRGWLAYSRIPNSGSVITPSMYLGVSEHQFGALQHTGVQVPSCSHSIYMFL
jgi:hypothetical protein